MTSNAENPLRYILDENGERTAVIVPIERYEELLEDLEDLAIAAERRNEETLGHREVLTELKGL